MKILKWILIVLVILIGVPLITALFVQKKYKVVQEITINKPKQEVFDYIKYLKNQDNFSKWANMDPEMKKTFTGTDATVGFISAWESNNPDVGKGEQEITAIDEGKRVDFEIRFLEPWESTDFAFMSTESISPDKTRVLWGFNGEMKYPMNLMFLFMDLEGMLNDDLHTGLTNLKDILEE